MSVTGGALESVNDFLGQACRMKPGEIRAFLYAGSDSGRWALAHYLGCSQKELEVPLPAEGILLRWRLGDMVYPLVFFTDEEIPIAVKLAA